MLGENFGPVGTPVAVSYSSPARPEFVFAPICNVSIAHTHLTCRTEPGVGSNLQWQVEIGGQFSVGSSVAYCLPAITNISVRHDPARGSSNCDLPLNETGLVFDTEGRSEMLIEGVNFGDNDRDVVVKGISVRAAPVAVAPVGAAVVVLFPLLLLLLLLLLSPLWGCCKTVRVAFFVQMRLYTQWCVWVTASPVSV